MKSSARNRFEGTIAAVREGAVTDEIELALDEGCAATAIFKASNVVIGVHR